MKKLVVLAMTVCLTAVALTGCSGSNTKTSTEVSKGGTENIYTENIYTEHIETEHIETESMG